MSFLFRNRLNVAVAVAYVTFTPMIWVAIVGNNFMMQVMDNIYETKFQCCKRRNKMMPYHT